MYQTAWITDRQLEYLTLTYYAYGKQQNLADHKTGLGT